MSLETRNFQNPRSYATTATVERCQSLGLTEEPLDLRRDEREHKRSEATGVGVAVVERRRVGPGAGYSRPRELRLRLMEHRLLALEIV